MGGTHQSGQGRLKTEYYPNRVVCNPTVADVHMVGEEEIDGIAVWHFTARTNMLEKAKIYWPEYDVAAPEVREGWELPRQQLIGGSESLEFWVAKSDNIVRRMKVTASYPAVAFLEAYQFEFTTGFFDFNVPIVIQQVPA